VLFVPVVNEYPDSVPIPIFPSPEVVPCPAL